MSNSASLNSTEETNFATCSDSNIDGRLQAAIDLWKKSRSTLGPFPKGAFEDHAEKNWIIYLLVEGQVEGYLLYRLARNRAVIAHLCVSPEIRGTGGARVLVDSLKNSINDRVCRGVEVRCRSDYAISRMWPKLGFEFIRNVRGRAKDGSELTIWFYRFDVDDFFYDMMPQQGDDDLTWAILDANIVFKLSNPSDRSSEEALALTSDTITPYTRYFVTPELFAEIERNKAPTEKKRSTKFARKFERIETKQSAYEKFREELMPIWEKIDTDRDRSDLNHIAYAAAAGFQTFITQDDGILKKADAIFTACSVNVLRPVEFIIELDQLENSAKYDPQSLSRTEYQVSCPVSDEIPILAENFCLPHKGEKRKQLEAQIRASIAHPSQCKTVLVSQSDGTLIALLCFKRENEKLSIQLMRHNGSVASKTIAQNFAWNEIFSHSETGIGFIEFIDEFSSQINSELFQSLGFIKTPKGWIRVSANLRTTFEEAYATVSNFLKSSQDIQAPIKDSLLKFIEHSKKTPAVLEEAFWPLKIVDAEIPTYLVPIKPNWALHLFDSSLADQELWGADPSKHFNIENVYYRSPKPFNTMPGARILWYVSTNKNSKISEIRACSRLMQTERDTAKKLFKKYQRLGIYQWRDLMKITKNDEHGDVTAMRFHQTEYFQTPIKLKDFSRFGINGQPMSPKHITASQFSEIYAHGMNIDEQ